MISVNRYIVLCGEDYYPLGWDDYAGSVDTIEEAVALAKSKERWSKNTEYYMSLYPDGPTHSQDNWVSIIDLSTMKEIDVDY